MLEQHSEIFWFFGGVFAYRFLATILTYGHLANTVKSVNDQVLKMLGTLASDIALIRGIKYEHLLESGFEKEEIDKIKIVDDRTFTVWKTMCIANMFTHCPKIYRNTMKYSDWGSAMEVLEKIYEKELSTAARRKKNEKKQNNT
tara:strand:+ start:98 stop:529 length:432 start_codon:yes stop_codon:yes gene_type:complete